MGLEQRRSKRSHRETMSGLAWVFVGSPVLVLIFARGNYGIAEMALMPIVGACMLLWQKRHPLPFPAHLAMVQHVRPGEPSGFYLALCDCGWTGDEDHADEASARREAAGHTSHVRPGLHEWGE